MNKKPTSNDGEEPRPGAIERDSFFALAHDILCIAGLDGIFKRVNPAFERILGHPESELLTRPFLEFIHPDDVEGTLNEMRTLTDGVITEYFENRYRCKDGTYKWLAWRAVPSVSEGLIYCVGRDVTEQKVADKAIRDEKDVLEIRVAERTQELADFVERLQAEVAERSRAEESAYRQLTNVHALRKIDLAITGSVDLRVILDVVLDQVTSRLGVDAATVMLFSDDELEMRYAASRGFKTGLIRKSVVSIGEGYAGRAAMERRTVHSASLATDTAFSRADLVQSEGFVTYYGVPLLAKAQVKGVLEIFHRTPLHPDADWLDFLETLAGQAAIAIDSANMITQLERQNTELRIAYEATLEGWVGALDLRDKETEGHTQRVTELTMRLARRMNIPTSEHIHLRRGALLHDIGKIGIPDSILLKPGKLTDTEFELMKQHTVYAHHWLSGIQYLVPALHIPYCHHERWDGAGYPRGLSGESIPIQARLFAVVDVWDALTSDRPYRQAWPVDKVLQHIADGAGSHFDPQVAATFLQMMRDEHGYGDSSLPLAA